MLQFTTAVRSSRRLVVPRGCRLRLLLLYHHHHPLPHSNVCYKHFSTVPVPSSPRPQSELTTSLLDLQMAAKIEGEESQIVTIELKKGETLRAESGSMIYMTEGKKRREREKKKEINSLSLYIDSCVCVRSMFSQTSFFFLFYIIITMTIKFTPLHSLLRTSKVLKWIQI